MFKGINYDNVGKALCELEKKGKVDFFIYLFFYLADIY